MRQSPEDFVVEEVLGFDPDGDGEHAMLRIQKRGENTEYIARQLARLADVKQVDVGYAGLKDRHAVTIQWFTVNLSGKPEPDWSELESENIRILDITRHRRKLKRGALKGNRFVITLRDVQGDREEIAARLELIKDQGVPNYFGEQRFGRDNIDKALAMFRGDVRPKRHQRGIYLSAARSLLFNAVLSERVRSGLWNKPVDGDVMMLDGSNSVFTIDDVDNELIGRCRRFDVHPAGPLPGRGGKQAEGKASAIEKKALEVYQEPGEGIAKAGVDATRRAMRVTVNDLAWSLEKDRLKLEFGLPSGSYATSMIRELVLTS